MRKKHCLVIFIIFSLLFSNLSFARPDTSLKAGAGATPFTWNQNEVWQTLEARFRDVRLTGCRGIAAEIEKRLQEGKRHLAALEGGPLQPADSLFDALEANLFSLGPLMAACPERIDEYAAVIMSLRSALKKQSVAWDLNDGRIHDRVYRILYGSRIALEEVMLQAPTGSLPAILPGMDEPSGTPSYRYRGITLHSGDILVSRGGAPTSALIARGNDHPGNFSHIALLYVDENTGKPSIIEAHIERGVVISSPEEYIGDVKLRIMVLRVNSDHPLVRKDPLLPHRAAKRAYEQTKKKHIPYDFSMDFNDPSKQFCSAVAYQAYLPFGIKLWSFMTTMSSPGVVRWLGDFGVKNFLTLAPADLEYDSQLSVVAEARDKDALWQAHIDDAVIDAMLGKAEQGDRLTCPWYLLVPAVLGKAYSVMLNLLGKVGPVPEGMSVTAAVRATQLEKKHKRLKDKVLSEAAIFNEKNGYRPPYWELVHMAREANQ